LESHREYPFHACMSLHSHKQTNPKTAVIFKDGRRDINHNRSLLYSIFGIPQVTSVSNFMPRCIVVTELSAKHSKAAAIFQDGGRTINQIRSFLRNIYGNPSGNTGIKPHACMYVLQLKSYRRNISKCTAFSNMTAIIQM
jgi:hypothetical protein